MEGERREAWIGVSAFRWRGHVAVSTCRATGQGGGGGAQEGAGSAAAGRWRVKEPLDAVFQLVKVVVEELALYVVRGVDVGEFPWGAGEWIKKVPGTSAGSLQRKIMLEYVLVPVVSLDLLVAHLVVYAMGVTVMVEECFDKVHRLVKRDGGDPVGEFLQLGGYEVIEKILVVVRECEVGGLSRHVAIP